MAGERDYCPVEWDFILPDGTRVTETLVTDGDLRHYFKKHGAVSSESTYPLFPQPTPSQGA